MSIIQIRIDELIKINAAIENGGMPFPVRLNNELEVAIEDAKLKKNLYGPFKDGDEAVKSMLEN